MAPNGIRNMDSATKIYRIRRLRDSDEKNVDENVTDADDALSWDGTICVGTSLAKPKPPLSMMKHTRSDLAKLKSRNVIASLKKKTAIKEKRIKQEPTVKFLSREKASESNVMSAKVDGKQDVLASLKKLNLLKPFLNNRSSDVSWTDHNFPLLQSKSVQQTNVLKENVAEKYKEGNVPKRNNDSHVNSSLNYSKNEESAPLKGEKKVDKKTGGFSDVVHEPVQNLTLSNPYVPEVFLRFENNGNGVLDYRETSDTSDNESIVYRDAYNNKIFVTGSSSYNLRHETPLAVGVLSNEDVKPNNKQHHAKLTQRQLSYVGAAPPTATVVDISTGGVVDKSPEVTDSEDFAFNEHVQHLRSMAGSKTSLPSSFYYKRKIKKRQKEDELEMNELKKLKDKAREEIRNILKSTSEMDDKIEPETMRTASQLPPNKRLLEFKVVDIPPIQHIDMHNEDTNAFESIEKLEDNPSRSPSAATTSSSLSSVEIHPGGPNPSPQLAPNRFHIFPTSNPNTFHAYTHTSSQPTVINMDHFVQARMSLNEQQKSEKSKKQTAATVTRRIAAGGGVKILVSNDRSKPHKSFNADALVKGHSINASSSGTSDRLENTTSNEALPKSSEKHGSACETSGSETTDEKQPPRHLETEKSFQASRFMTAAGESRKAKGQIKVEPRKHTPLQSLVIKSCQSVNPVLVIPESVAQESNDTATTIAPSRTQTARGHLSPLKGIRILRRKVTVRHYEDTRYSDPEKTGFRNLPHEPRTMQAHGMYFSDEDQINRSRSDALRGGLKTEDNLRSIEVVSSSYNGSKRLEPPLNNARKSSKDVPRFLKEIHLDGLVGSSLPSGMSIDKLCLDKDKAPPYLLLKEGASQSLNFINPNLSPKFSLGPLSSDDTKEVVEKSAKRRRKIQLGSVGGSDDCVCVKIAAGGGFKSNVARYSLLLRQKYHRHQEDLAQKQLEQDNLLEISKAGLDVNNRFESETQKLLELIANSRNGVLEPAIEEAVENCEETTSPVEEQAISASNESRLQIRDLLANLGGDSPGLYQNEDIAPKGGAIRRKSLDLVAITSHKRKAMPSESRLANLVSTDTLKSSTPTLPDSGTASYRLTHDVSFDEGSRYEGSGAGALNSYKSGNEDTKNGSNRRRIAYASNDDQSNGRPDKLSDPYNRERAGPPAGFKETPTLSFMRSDDRQNPSFGFMTSPGSRGQSAQVTNSTPVPMQPVSASRSTAFRVSKESRQSWNHRMGDLSVNGGGLYGSSPIQPGGRVDTSGLASLSINPPTSYSQKISQSRDKNGVSPLKSRLSSRYGNRFEGPHSFTTSAGKESLYADPCIGAPCSFQQRLTELSLLESDTVKYEKSRKTKRKSKQDKDS